MTRNSIIVLSKLAFVLVFILSSIVFASVKGCNKKDDELFYKSGTILDIRRDDESQFYLLVRLEDNSVISINDAWCDIKMGNYKTPKAKLPYVNSYDIDNHKTVLECWEATSSKYSRLHIKVYLPENMVIALFKDGW